MLKTILIVDDEPSILRLLSKYFERQGYEVHCAENADEALKLAENNVFYGHFIDIGLTGITGDELFKLLKENNPNAFFFAMTGNATDSDHQDCLDIGFNKCFFKPLELAVISEAIKSEFEKLSIK